MKSDCINCIFANVKTQDTTKTRKSWAFTKAKEDAIQSAVTIAKEDGTITYAQEVTIQGS